jgi:hypothetical protein
MHRTASPISRPEKPRHDRKLLRQRILGFPVKGAFRDAFSFLVGRRPSPLAVLLLYLSTQRARRSHEDHKIIRLRLCLSKTTLKLTRKPSRRFVSRLQQPRPERRRHGDGGADNCAPDPFRALRHGLVPFVRPWCPLCSISNDPGCSAPLTRSPVTGRARFLYSRPSARSRSPTPGSRRS